MVGGAVANNSLGSAVQVGIVMGFLGAVPAVNLILSASSVKAWVMAVLALPLAIIEAWFGDLGVLRSFCHVLRLWHFDGCLDVLQWHTVELGLGPGKQKADCRASYNETHEPLRPGSDPLPSPRIPTLRRIGVAHAASLI